MTIFHPSPDRPAGLRILDLIDIERDDWQQQMADTRADALLLDLSACGNAADARAQLRVAAVSGATARRLPWFVGLHRLDETDELALDIEVAIAIAAEGVALPHARSGADVQHLHVLLDAAEASEAGMNGSAGEMALRRDGRRLSILAFAGDNPAGLLAAGSFAGKSDRLAAICWRGDTLAANLGAPAPSGGSLMDSCRSLTRLAAAAAGVAAMDWLQPHQDDGEARAAAMRDGFDWLLRQHLPAGSRPGL